MRERVIGALVGVAVLAISLWALLELADLVILRSVGSVEFVLMLVPTALAIGFALLVWLKW
ncbi:hypothetical protein [Halobellus sp. GM3]|uniref:hypothetical protein n=1 Tax=Halobellus sp. GM3 TaxID=3458410 RepID=UPI00403E0748